MLVKIHATWEYFFTTTNMADVKSEINFVEKHRFAEVGFQITMRYFTCKLGRMLLATLTVVLK